MPTLQDKCRFQKPSFVLSHCSWPKREATAKTIKTIFNSLSVFVYFILKPPQTNWGPPKYQMTFVCEACGCGHCSEMTLKLAFSYSPLKTEFSVAAHITYVVKYLLIKIATIQAGLAELSCALSYHFALSDAGLHRSSRHSPAPCWTLFFKCVWLKKVLKIPEKNSRFQPQLRVQPLALIFI